MTTDHKYRPICDEGADNLVEAIVAQASFDYRAAKSAAKDKPRIKAIRRMKLAEGFFRSSWFHTLTGLDGNAVLARLSAM